MANEWESKQLPRSADGVGPAYWNREENDWMPYEGDTNIVAELESIKETQTEILKRLDDPLDTRLTGSNVDFKNTKIENNDVIGNGESESFAVFSSDGLLAKVSNFYFRISAPENATTGKHRIIIGIGGTLNHNRIIEKSANFDQSLSVTVTDEEVLNAILSGLYMDSEDNYLRVYYQNNTDVDQENSRITSVKSVEGVAIV